MGQMKNSLKNIKVAIFDFDDTLAIHKDKDYQKHRNESEENIINFNKIGVNALLPNDVDSLIRDNK